MPPIPTPTPSVLRANTALPSDPALRAVTNDVLEQLKYSFTAHAAGESAGAPGELDRTLATFMATRTPAARGRYRGHARTALAAPLPQRTAAIGRYAAVSTSDYRVLGSERLRSRVAAPAVDPQQLTAALKTLGAELMTMPPNDGPGLMAAPDSDLAAGLKFHKLRLLVDSVHCFEETDGTFEGSDEISLGGTVTSARGKSAIVNQFKVSEDFDEGETKHFIPGRPFTTWTVVTDNDWPHVYGSVVVMVDKDNGGFYAFLQALWAQVEAKVKAAISVAIGAGVGAAIGTAFGGIVGLIAGGIIGVLVGWIISLFKNSDDVLGVAVLTMTLASAKKSYYDWAKLTSKGGFPVEIHFKGEGGHYRLKGAYKLSQA